MAVREPDGYNGQVKTTLWGTWPTFESWTWTEQNMAQLLATRQVEILRVPEFKESLTVTTSVYGMKPMFGFRNTFIYVPI